MGEREREGGRRPIETERWTRACPIAGDQPNHRRANLVLHRRCHSVPCQRRMPMGRVPGMLQVCVCVHASTRYVMRVLRGKGRCETSPLTTTTRRVIGACGIATVRKCKSGLKKRLSIPIRTASFLMKSSHACLISALTHTHLKTG